MTINLLGNRVLLAPVPRRTLKLHGVFLPEAYVDPTAHQQYRVLAVGPGSWKPGPKYWTCLRCGWTGMGRRACHSGSLTTVCYTQPSERASWRLSRHRVLVPPEVQPGDYVLLDGSHDHQTLYDGRKVVDASQLLAKWSAT